MSNYAPELEFAKTIALEAAEIARRRSRSALPQEKSNRSYVTDLDLELERRIREQLRERFPGDALSGEEHASEGSGPRRWSIDPIDGTGNLVHDLPMWAVSIGLLVEGEPVVGVIAIPPLNELYWASKGGGAWRDGERLGPLLDVDELHPQDHVNVGTKASRRLDPRTIFGRIRGIGSACTEQSFLAAGRLQACVFMGEAEHDLAAGAVIIGEVGAAISTLDGRRLTPAEFVARTPVQTPTLVAAPKRLALLLERIKLIA